MVYGSNMFHIVDDEEFISELVEEIIQDHGYDTMSFNCPEEYIGFVKSPEYKAPIAVFTDVTMPAMNGYEMLDVISQHAPDLKFAVMTGECEIRSEHIHKACMYLKKPFAPESLIKVLDSLIRCHASSPSDDHGCTSANVDNRKMFPIENWSCPHTGGDCASDCA